MNTFPEIIAASVTIARPALYLVATPIGNLGDISLRALEVLKGADFVYAEDTRNTAHLLATYGISRALDSLHEQNEQSRVAALIERMRAGSAAIALVSDAGTPLISDPGFRLVQAAHLAGIAVHAVPGASAVLAALTTAALTVDRFAFEGFLPTRQAARRARLGEVLEEVRTSVFFEAPHRIQATVLDMVEILGPRRLVCVARELTKQFETIYRGALGEVAARISADANASRGEIVIVIAPGEKPPLSLAAIKLLSALLPRLTTRDAVEVVADTTGAPRNLLYAYALAQQT